jgi:hypothetical protein
MHPDLQQLIDLQGLDRDLESLRHAIEAVPRRREAIETRVALEAEAVGAAKQRVADNRAARQAIEKDLQLQQGRLSKYRDQLMAVKTNKEYQAMQVEIATAEGEVRRLEDQLLERMMEADEAAAALKQAEATHAADRAAAQQEVAALEREADDLARRLAARNVEREALAARIGAEPLAVFESVRARRGALVVVEARDGHCTVCHVRLRPQVFNEIRRNEQLIKCDSCGRLLYFVPPATPAPAAQP